MLKEYIQYDTIYIKFKIYQQPWLVWLSGLSIGLGTERLPVQFLGSAHACVAGQVPVEGV